MRMEQGLDAGPYCAVATTPIGEKNAVELTRELALLGADLLTETLPRIANGSAEWTAQDESQVTYADKVGKNELALAPTDPAILNLRRVRASTPAAPARCVICNRPVTILAAAEATPAAAPGEVVFSDKRLSLGAANEAFEVVSLKPDGGRELPAAAFAVGVRELQKDQPTPATWRAVQPNPT
jgi:methionyl-tRNA formyltransferase